MDEPALPDVDYNEAVQGYMTQFGELPNARQLGLFLAHYGVVDPVTGSVLTEGQLRPILQDFKMQIPQPPVPADEQEGLTEEVVLAPVESDGTDGRGAGADAPADRRSFSTAALTEASAGSQLDAIDSVPVSAASAAGDLGTGGGVPQQAALSILAARTVEASVSEAGRVGGLGHRHRSGYRVAARAADRRTGRGPRATADRDCRRVACRG